MAGAVAVAAVDRTRASRARSSDDDPVVVVGGGVMGLCIAWRLVVAGEKVVLCDALNPLRGSWGETRASHLAMEDHTLLRMGASSILHPEVLYRPRVWLRRV